MRPRFRHADSLHFQGETGRCPWPSNNIQCSFRGRGSGRRRRQRLRPCISPGEAWGQRKQAYSAWLLKQTQRCSFRKSGKASNEGWQRDKIWLAQRSWNFVEMQFFRREERTKRWVCMTMRCRYIYTKSPAVDVVRVCRHKRPLVMQRNIEASSTFPSPASKEQTDQDRIHFPDPRPTAG